MTDTSQVEQIRELVSAGGAADTLAEKICDMARNTPYWSHEAGGLLETLLGLAETDRKAVAKTLHRRVGRLRHENWQLSDKVGALSELLDAYVPGQAGVQAATEYLAVAGTRSTIWETTHLQLAIQQLAMAAEPVPAEVVAVARRTTETGRMYSQFKQFVSSLEEPILNPGEAWADQVMADLPALDETWLELIRHARTAASAKPTPKWEKRGRELLAAIGEEDARQVLTGWVGLVGRPRTTLLAPTEYDGAINELLDSYNSTAVRGLVWLLAFLPDDPDTTRTLGFLVEAMLRKVPGHGPRNPKVANSAVYALSRIDGDASVGQLARLASRVTFKGTLKVINSALDAKAEALGLTRDEVEELAVPGYGLTEVGRAVEKFGDAAAEILVDGTVKIVWRNDSGKAVKAPPAAVKRDFPDELKEVKAAVKDITKMLAAQTERLDRQFLAQRVWAFGPWRERYLDHPLVGTLARRLLWIVDDTPCGFADGQLCTVDDVPIVPAPDAEVRLWHPVGRPVDEVVAWRDWLERHQIVQPFKQAHREVYLLTAAEENTRIYSNRFAAHIIRQHQFHALAAARGWRNRLRLMVDDSYEPPRKELPQWGLRAEFWVEGIGDDYGQDTTESGSYLRLATDQVRFYSVSAPENLAHSSGGGYEQWVGQNADPTDPIPLSDVPVLVLSEVLRDVDLFVGVASVGNDPTWSDGGPEGRFRDYWHSYSFGELTATAQTRRDLLSRLVPRLAIADRVSVDGRFLVVRGDLRAYKIHMGSGNILMSPNDEYLCIVPGQVKSGGSDGGFLPFEGDRVLSVILSKAILLARDTKITDPTIVSQIKRS